MTNSDYIRVLEEALPTNRNFLLRDGLNFLEREISEDLHVIESLFPHRHTSAELKPIIKEFISNVRKYRDLKMSILVKFTYDSDK